MEASEFMLGLVEGGLLRADQVWRASKKVGGSSKLALTTDVHRKLTVKSGARKPRASSSSPLSQERTQNTGEIVGLYDAQDDARSSAFRAMHVRNVEFKIVNRYSSASDFILAYFSDATTLRLNEFLISATPDADVEDADVISAWSSLIPLATTTTTPVPSIPSAIPAAVSPLLPNCNILTSTTPFRNPAITSVPEAGFNVKSSANSPSPKGNIMYEFGFECRLPQRLLEPLLNPPNVCGPRAPAPAPASMETSGSLSTSTAPTDESRLNRRRSVTLPSSVLGQSTTTAVFVFGSSTLSTTTSEGKTSKSVRNVGLGTNLDSPQRITAKHTLTVREDKAIDLNNFLHMTAHLVTYKGENPQRLLTPQRNPDMPYIGVDEIFWMRGFRLLNFNEVICIHIPRSSFGGVHKEYYFTASLARRPLEDVVSTRVETTATGALEPDFASEDVEPYLVEL
ncbi:hypothetical protein HK102_005104 [Quaeritorhiza haematococci]|nr:hypothetical protein HK102_005104 [Quaeritorhiza haematococci]